jgi:hypothetical protein
MFEIGSKVRVRATGHRHDGRTGTVVYRGTSTWGVSIDGRNYGFTPDELETTSDATSLKVTVTGTPYVQDHPDVILCVNDPGRKEAWAWTF